jgi:diphthamide biosynthesis protein 2
VHHPICKGLLGGRTTTSTTTTTTTTTMANQEGRGGSRAPPQKLLFDDGSRAMMATTTAATAEGDVTGVDATTPSLLSGCGGRDETMSIAEYYEIDRIARAIFRFQQQRRKPRQSSSGSRRQCHVALQFPDELLGDSPLVCWELEQHLGQFFAAPPPFPPTAGISGSTSGTNHDEDDDDTGSNNSPGDHYLVFVLGDTTYAPCCPDTGAARHLNADVLVHYGPACLSSTTTATASSISERRLLPILYSFGRQPVQVEQLVDAVLAQQQPGERRRFVLLYQVQYQYAVEEIQTTLSEREDVLVVAGQIPCFEEWATQEEDEGEESTLVVVSRESQEHDCCESNKSDVHFLATASTQRCTTTTAAADPSSCGCIPTSNETILQPNRDDDCTNMKGNSAEDDNGKGTHRDERTATIGGLELPSHILADLNSYTVLYIGEDTSRQFVNIMLRFLSISTTEARPRQVWTYTDAAGLQTDAAASPSLTRVLRRRFYLVQKAKECRVFGILVGHVSAATQAIVKSIRDVLSQRDGTSSYTLVVGKINPAKLANFPEIECFVLVACPEHSLLQNERELYPVPIITPTELLMAMGTTEWGGSNMNSVYSNDHSDYWKRVSDAATRNVDAAVNDDDGNDNSDAPYFSLVSGQYKTAIKARAAGDGQVAATDGTLSTYYASAAADFLARREYQGLSTVLRTAAAASPDGSSNNDAVVVHAAQPGQTGIASDYGNR